MGSVDQISKFGKLEESFTDEFTNRESFHKTYVDPSTKPSKLKNIVFYEHLNSPWRVIRPVEAPV